MELVSKVPLTIKDVLTFTGWATPFVWIAVWALISIPWVRREMHKETVTWDSVCESNIEKGATASENSQSPPVE